MLVDRPNLEIATCAYIGAVFVCLSEGLDGELLTLVFLPVFYFRRTMSPCRGVPRCLHLYSNDHGDMRLLMRTRIQPRCEHRKVMCVVVHL
jgi:hypothetical protein